MSLVDIENRVTPPYPVASLKMYESYEGDELDIAETSFAVSYWNLRQKAEAQMIESGQQPYTEEQLKETPEGKLFQSQLMANALSIATVSSSKKKGSFDRAFLILANRLNQTGFYRMVKGEYDTIEQWLADQILELQPGSGELSNIRFLLNEFLPLVEEIGNGFTAERLLQLKEQKTKTYAAIPHLRDVADRAAETEKRYNKDIVKAGKQINRLETRKLKANSAKAAQIQDQIDLATEARKRLVVEAEAAKQEHHKIVKQALERTLEIIQDPSIPAWGPNGVGDVLKRGQGTIFEGDKCYIVDQDNEEAQVVFNVVVPIGYERAVESMLRKLVEFSQTDGEVIIVALSRLIIPKKQKGG